MADKPTFEQACAVYVNRFTMDHVPEHMANRTAFDDGGTVKKYYAPQFRSDREWYDNTRFPGETGHISFGDECYTTGQTWPLGRWLSEPYRKGMFHDAVLGPDWIALARIAGYDGSPGGEQEWCEGNGMAPAAPKVPLGFTHTEIEESRTTDSALVLADHVNQLSDVADDYLDGDYTVELVAETLTDGSIKRSVRNPPRRLIFTIDKD